MNFAAILARFSRLIRYGLVGIFVFAVYILLTILFHASGWIADPTLASAAAFSVSLPLSYFSHRHTTYADSRHERGQWVRFGVIGLLSFVVAAGSMKIVTLLHRPYWIALVITCLLIPPASFVVNAVWIFRVSSLLAVDGKRPKAQRRTAPRLSQD